MHFVLIFFKVFFPSKDIKTGLHLQYFKFRRGFYFHACGFLRLWHALVIADFGLCSVKYFSLTFATVLNMFEVFLKPDVVESSDALNYFDLITPVFPTFGKTTTTSQKVFFHDKDWFQLCYKCVCKLIIFDKEMTVPKPIGM